LIFILPVVDSRWKTLAVPVYKKCLTNRRTLSRGPTKYWQVSSI